MDERKRVLSLIEILAEPFLLRVLHLPNIVSTHVHSRGRGVQNHLGGRKVHIIIPECVRAAQHCDEGVNIRPMRKG